MTDTRKSPRKARLVPAGEVFSKWQKDAAYRQAYDALEEEFAIMSALIKARTAAGLSQSELAKRMNTTQPAIARLEGGAHRASLTTIRNYAAATGHRVKIFLEAIPPKR